MKNHLKDYFPAVWTVDEWERCLQEDAGLQKIFREWPIEHQKEFLDLCTGVQGVDTLQPAFFQAVMDPGRLKDLLSVVLQKKIRQLERREGWREGQELICLASGLYLEFEDGERALAEIWKAGRMFSGQECACHSAQALTGWCQEKRQEQGKSFKYSDVGRVCIIILLENSPVQSDKGAGGYLHTGRISFDTGLELGSLQEYHVLDLDLYQRENWEKDIQGRFDGWMSFLACRRPEKIVQLIKTYPCFKGIYEEIYGICRDIQRILHIFGEGLRCREKDQNRRTVQEMQEVIERLTRQHEEDRKALELQDIENRQREDKISGQYREAMRRIEELEKMLA